MAISQFKGKSILHLNLFYTGNLVKAISTISNLRMERSRLLAVFAWYFDLVLIESVIWPMRDLVDKNDGTLYHLSVLSHVIIFILSIIYHVRWKNSTLWISPGEYLIGYRKPSEKKEVMVHYSIHRTVLFGIILINCLCTVKTLGVTYFGLENSWVVFAINYGFNFLLLFGSLKLSEVKMIGLIGAGLALLFMASSHAVNYFGFDLFPSRNLLVFYLLLLIANVWVFIRYKSRRVIE